jgi:hypothetical protein
MISTFDHPRSAYYRWARKKQFLVSSYQYQLNTANVCPGEFGAYIAGIAEHERKV